MAYWPQMICSADRADRLRIDVRGTLRDADWSPVDVTIQDLSVTGVRMIAATKVRLGAMVSVGVAGLRIPAFVVRRKGQVYGCRFIHALPDEHIAQIQSGTRPIVEMTACATDRHADTAPRDDRYPLAWRVLTMAGLGVLSWAVLIGAFLLIR